VKGGEFVIETVPNWGIMAGHGIVKGYIADVALRSRPGSDAALTRARFPID